MKKPISRREFLRLAATGAGALALSEVLAACGVDAAPEPTDSLPPTEVQTATLEPSSTATTLPPTLTSTAEEAAVVVEQPTDTAEPTATQTQEPVPDLVAVRNGEPEQMVRQAIEAIGGVQKFVPSGADVIVKPNICVDFRTYEWGATTNPWVVGALVKMCFEAGASRVRVMDQTWKRNMTKAYQESGIQEQVEAAGGEMEWMPLDKFVPVDAPQGIDLQTFDIYDEFLQTDVFINVPVAKHHMDAKLTLSMKNLMGIISDRPIIHNNFGQRIADLASAIRPTLNVMDAVRVMTKYGPTGFAKKHTQQMDALVVSEDMVAIDSYATRFFDMVPEDLDYVVCAAAMGLGRSDLQNLNIQEIDLG